jgi:hypothetical protein
MGTKAAQPTHRTSLPVRLRGLARADQAPAVLICDTLSRRNGRLTRSAIRLYLGTGFEGDQRLDEVLGIMVQEKLLGYRHDTYRIITGEARRTERNVAHSLLAL